MPVDRLSFLQNTLSLMLLSSNTPTTLNVFLSKIVPVRLPFSVLMDILSFL